MQKDVHFNLTYAIARKAGISPDDACIIAWSDQHTDELTIAELHGIQTQSAILGNWSDKQIQRSVLVPFHFVPGGESPNPWVVKPDSLIAKTLVYEAIKSKDLIRIGIALHALQDTFSHQDFTGWDELHNACFPWYYIQSGLPNIGHAEMQVVPDVASMVWTDPRTGTLIDNKKRAFDCAFFTFKKLNSMTHVGPFPDLLESRLKEIFEITNYDNRKQAIIDLAGDDDIRYKKINAEFAVLYQQPFIAAASKHLAAAIELIKDLPLN